MEFGREVVCDYLERNKIPKLENLKLDLSGAIDGMMDFNEELNKISKDIQKRKDNAMAMEFTKCIGELLKKNGVVPKMKECTRNFEEDNTFETRYGVSIDELDFSEHDKPFEDEIAKREEAIGYYRDSLSSVEKNCDKLYRENKELKQRIAELESGKPEKPVAYVLAKEIDGQYYVTVEDFMSVVNNLQKQRAD